MNEQIQSQTNGAAVRVDPPAVQASAMQEAAVARNVWRLDVDPSLQPRDLLSTAFWSHVARKLRHGDRVEAETEDGSWFAEYFVVDAGMNYAKVVLLHSVSLEVQEPGQKGVSVTGYTVKWGGHVKKFRVVRDADGKVMQEGLPSKGAGFGWLEQFARTQLT